MNFFIIEYAQKVNNFSLSTYIHTCTRKLKKKYILFGIDGDRWNMLSEISEEVPVSVVP